MVILGLGSNLGDRLAHLRNALRLIKKIPQLTVSQVSPVYISDALLPENAPTSWDTPYLNLSVRCETTLAPYDLLNHTKQIEINLGRKPNKEWGPRVIDVDILAWDDLIQYDKVLHIPHECLHERPFALWPLADVAPHWVYPLPGPNQGKTAIEMTAKWGSHFSGDAPFHTRQIQQRIDTSQLVGVLNLTPNSFSDDGKLADLSHAVKTAWQLVQSGAEIIDIGAEATGPDATAITAEAEWQRLEPFLSVLLPELNYQIIKPKISIDTYHASTAEKVLSLGVDWINDVSGLTHPAMQNLLAKHSCDIVVMHHLGIPTRRDQTLPLNQDPVALVYEWADHQLKKLEALGISRERIIFDVGISFGKTAKQSFELLKNIHAFKNLGTRLLVGHSRKSFLQQFTQRPPKERDIETIALSLHLNKQAVDFVRIHDVDAHARAFKVAAAL